MRITGSFVTDATVEELRSLSSTPELLEQVDTLREVRRGANGATMAVFSPMTSLGRIPLRTTIHTIEESAEGARIAIRGSRGVQGVDVDLRLDFTPVSAGTEVAWAGHLVVRGAAASVGQRVVGDLATRAVQKVLVDAAEIAASTLRGVQ